MAAHQTMLAVSQLCFMLYYGMAAAVAVRVSYFRGAGQVAETRRTAMAGLHLTWILGLMTAIPIFLLRQRIGIWFANDTQVAALAAALVPVLCLYQFGDAMQCIYANALRGMAVVRPMIGIAFVAYFLISLPLGYLFAFPLGLRLVGVWLAFPFGLTSAGIMYFYWFMKSTAKT
jgi:MATE family multidrug resistance protein